MKVRTQYKYNDEDLKNLYRGYNSEYWADHRLRTEISASMVSKVCIDTGLRKVADLSAGDGKILKLVESGITIPIQVYAGDFAEENILNFPNYWNIYWNKIEYSIHEIPNVEMFILSETLEHVEEPDELLNNIGQKTNYIFVSTPLDEAPGINPEHYWSWGKEDVYFMLLKAGFKHTILYSELDFIVSKFQVWLMTQ